MSSATLTTPVARLGTKPRRRNLTQCARSSDMIELIGRHRVLTPQQIHALLAPPGSKITNTYMTLRALLEPGLVATGARRMFTSPHSAHGLLKHTWLTNEIGRAFVAASRAHGDECTWRSWGHEMTHGIDGGVLILDAVLSYVALTDTDVCAPTYFIEVDRLTESYDQVLLGTTFAAIARHGVTKGIWRTTNGPCTHQLP